MSFVHHTVRIENRLDPVTGSGHIVTTNKGDIITETGTYTTVLPVGTNNQVIMADSSQATGIKWSNISNANIADVAAIDSTKIADGSVSNTKFQQLSSIGSAVVGVSDSQTLTNKTLTAPNISTITNTGTLTLPTSTDTLVGRATTDTFTNKTIDAVSNTILNITNSAISVSATIDATKIADGSVSNTEFQQLNGIGSSVVGVSDAQTLTNKTLTDASTYIQDNVNTTKNVQFDVSSVTASTTRTMTFPDANTTLVGTNAIQTLTNKTFGDALNMNSNKITNMATPTADTDAVNKLYVDSMSQGLHAKEPVRVRTVSALPLYTQNGTGVGATLTATSNGALPNIDDVALQTDDRILVDSNGSTTDSDNGIYVVTQIGDVSNPWILTRATDADNEVSAGLYVFVTEGAVSGDTGYILTTNNPITIDTTDLTFSQFSSAGQFVAGAGMTKIGTTIDVGGSTTIIANANNLEINSSATANQVLLSSGIVGVAAIYGAVPLNNTNAITGTLGIANGGTGATTFTSGNFLQGNGSSAITAIKTIPAGTVVGTSDIQSLTNKTIDADSNTITNIDNNDIKALAAIDATKIADGSVSNTEFQQLASIGSAVVGVSDTQTLTNKTLTSPNITTITNTGTLTLPTSTDTLVGRATTDTFTNKTIDAVSNTISNISNTQIKVAAAIDATKIADGSVTSTEFQQLNGIGSSAVGVSDTQTLTNKTLTSVRIQTSLNDTNGNELIIVTPTAMAINELTIANAIAGSGPTISATGGSDDIDLNLIPKGAGQVVIDNHKWPNADGGANQVLKTDGAGNIGYADVDIISINTTTTTNATETTIATLATSSNTAYIIEAHIIAIRTDSGAETCGFILRGVFRNTSGTLTKVGEDRMYARDTGANWDSDIAVSNTNIVITVIGQASKTIKWKVSYKATSIA